MGGGCDCARRRASHEHGNFGKLVGAVSGRQQPMSIIDSIGYDGEACQPVQQNKGSAIGMLRSANDFAGGQDRVLLTLGHSFDAPQDEEGSRCLISSSTAQGPRPMASW